MKFEKLNVIKLNNGNKIIILEKLKYNNSLYLYVDDVNEDETNTLDNYYIMRVKSNGSLVKVEDISLLTKIIPLFNKLLRDSYN